MKYNFTMKGGERLDNGLLKQSAFNNLIIKALYAVGKHWHTKMRPKHFKESAYSEYGYARRSKKHNDAKKAKFGHTRPLEWEGKTKTNTQFMFNIEATRNKVTVSYAGASTLNRRSKGQVFRMQDEFTKVMPKELDELEQVAANKLQELVNAAIARL